MNSRKTKKDGKKEEGRMQKRSKTEKTRYKGRKLVCVCLFGLRRILTPKARR